METKTKQAKAVVVEMETKKHEAPLEPLMTEVDIERAMWVKTATGCVIRGLRVLGQYGVYAAILDAPSIRNGGCGKSWSSSWFETEEAAKAEAIRFADSKKIRIAWE